MRGAVFRSLGLCRACRGMRLALLIGRAMGLHSSTASAGAATCGRAAGAGDFRVRFHAAFPTFPRPRARPSRLVPMILHSWKRQAVRAEFLPSLSPFSEFVLPAFSLLGVWRLWWRSRGAWSTRFFAGVLAARGCSSSNDWSAGSVIENYGKAGVLAADGAGAGSSGYPEELSSFLAEGTIDLRDLDHVL